MKTLRAVVALSCLAAASAFAQDPPSTPYLLRVTKETALDRVLRTYRLTPLRDIGWLGNLHVVAGPEGVAPATLVSIVRADKNVRTFEPDYVATTGEMAAARPDLQQTTQTLTEALAVDRTLVDFHGSRVWSGYAHQPALTVLDIDKARAEGRYGDGIIVAVIDNGIDPDDAVLKDVLLPGYDFTRNQAGASEWLDLDSATVTALTAGSCAGLTQSSAAIMDGTNTSVLTQSTAAIMDGCQAAVVTQSTAAIMDASAVEQLDSLPPLPADFGHGTIVAGLIHAVAPGARILPIKAFRADGTGRASDITQAIYYAINRGARIINMSFTFSSNSQEVMFATALAALSGRILVAASGNEGLVVQRWPAEHRWVVGVCSTTLGDARSTFSNQGYATCKLGAPGENLITTYPGNHYASVSGTSFSAALVSGAAALMTSCASTLDWGVTAAVVESAPFAEISNIVRDSDNQYPRRLIIPPAVDLATILQKTTIKRINNIR